VYGLNEDFAIQATQEFKTGRGGSNPYMHNVDLGLVYKGLADWIDISGNFKKEYDRDGFQVQLLTRRWTTLLQWVGGTGSIPGSCGPLSGLHNRRVY